MNFKLILTNAAIAVIIFSIGFVFTDKLIQKRISQALKNIAPASQFPAGAVTADKNQPVLPGVNSQPAVQDPSPAIKKQSIVGVIASIADEKITIQVGGGSSPWTMVAESQAGARTVVAGKETKIYKLTQRGQAVFNQEMSEYKKKFSELVKQGQAADMEKLPPVQIFYRTEAVFSDLKAGQTISAGTGAELPAAGEIAATTIGIFPDRPDWEIPKSGG